MNLDSTDHNSPDIPNNPQKSLTNNSDKTQTKTPKKNKKYKMKKEEVKDSVKYAVAGLARLTFWLKFITFPISIAGTILAVLLLITHNFTGGIYGVIDSICIILLACSCLLPIIASNRLWDSANQIKRASQTGEQETALSGITNLNRFFMFMSISGLFLLIFGSIYYFAPYYLYSIQPE